MVSFWKLRTFKIISIVKIVGGCENNISIYVIDITTSRDVERNAKKKLLIIIYLLPF